MSERKGRTVSRHDARLAKTAISLAKGYLEAGIDPLAVGGIDWQNAAMLENYADALIAVSEGMSVGGEDVKGLWRLARKARSLRRHGG